MSVPPLDVSLLEIVGYADVVPLRACPSVVPPVFCRKGDRHSFLVPPYSFSTGSYLCDASEITRSQLESLAHRQEVTLFFDAPIDARKEFDLWLDQNGQLQYQPRSEARAALELIVRTELQVAEKAFRLRNFQDAERHASVALLADGGSATVWALQLAIAKATADMDSVGLLREMIPSNVSDVVNARVECLLRDAGLAGGRPKMRGIALPQYRVAA